MNMVKNSFPVVHIVGGTGKMGLWFKNFLTENNVSVTAKGRDFLRFPELLKQADIVVISVPIAVTEKVIQQVIPHLKKTSLLADITSVKVMPLLAMEKASCDILGMHPLFGPSISSLIGQKIVFCKQKKSTHIQFLRALFEKAGSEIIDMSPEEHDYQVAYIQALTHATHLLYAKTILGQEKTIMTKLQTPTFALHALTMGKILHQDLELMGGIQLYNPYFLPVFDSLLENAGKLLKILQEGDQKLFAEFFIHEQKLSENFSGVSTLEANKIFRLITDTPTNIPQKTPALSLSKSTKVGYLGPVGTYSYVATSELFGNMSHTKIAYGALFEVFQGVLNQDVDLGIVPAENSIEGSMRGTLDYLAEFSLYVSGSFEIPIHHQLLSYEKGLGHINMVVSHPQALAQCKKWLKEHLPKARLFSSESTTAIIKSPKKGYAYIASRLAAKTYNISIIAKNIEDLSSNATRFYVITKNPVQLKGISNTKTLIFATVYNRVGILRDILDVFANHAINLSKLESRPSQEKMWDYHFFIEVEKKHTDPMLLEALQELKTHCPVIRVLGQT